MGTKTLIKKHISTFLVILLLSKVRQSNCQVIDIAIWAISFKFFDFVVSYWI